MTLISFFGNGFTAYGPALAVFFLYIAKNAQLVLLLMTSAFFWLVSILISSVFWYLIKAMQDVPAATIFVSVTWQEIWRYLFFIMMSKAEPGLNSTSRTPDSRFNRTRHAFATGLGFGLMSGLTLYLTQLAESSGPAILPCSSCPGADVFFIGAVTTNLFIFLHTAWNMIAFEGWYKQRWLPFAFVLFSHYAASYGTLLIPSDVHNGCLISIALCIVLLVIATSLVVRTINW
ncbi:gamma-secretase subunit Aph-1 [Fimicolochytrium jonesii]|uniref:gamma-secretase subunit Aph-1 n=1 Tax=Fimicolochytrium jonesii TaxID=1396493 RepID=UPI0022FED14E|nr:gamma-secretase subunit Aph-1 [Fimicolochytrium jonesii]KAI8818601.1 gamma-secretase subunit Aph-1 [Fimicolochytrium jonesii]